METDPSPDDAPTGLPSEDEPEPAPLGPAPDDDPPQTGEEAMPGIVTEGSPPDAGDVGEDDEKRAEAETQKVTDLRVGELDAALKVKEAEILEV